VKIKTLKLYYFPLNKQQIVLVFRHW